jgi:hypothetical protein
MNIIDVHVVVDVPLQVGLVLIDRVDSIINAPCSPKTYSYRLGTAIVMRVKVLRLFASEQK